MFRGKRSLGGVGTKAKGRREQISPSGRPWDRKRRVGLRRRGLCPGRDDFLSTDVQRPRRREVGGGWAEEGLERTGKRANEREGGGVLEQTRSFGRVEIETEWCVRSSARTKVLCPNQLKGIRARCGGDE